MTSNAAKSETKATKTLGVIMGAFTACWLPFFILALIKALLGDESIPPWLSSILLWLGFANSFLNPIIYARFNREFRTPFKEILLGRCRGINVRMRSESYTEQYGEGASGGSRPSMRRPSSGVNHLSVAQTDQEVSQQKPPSLIEEDDVFVNDTPPSPLTVVTGNGVKLSVDDTPNNNSIL